MLKLALRTLPFFAVIVGFAMALGAYMNYSGVRGAYLDLIESRMTMVLDDLATNVDSAVSVGIPPSEQTLLPSLLARLTEAESLIRSIEVEAPDGEVLFTSASGRKGTQVAVGNTFQLARTVKNDFGAPVAKLVVYYDRQAPTEKIDRLGASILSDALPAGILAALAGSIAAFLVLRQLHRRADRAVNSNSVDVIDVVEREIDELSADQIS
jgi:hypothetical protein